MKRIWLTKINLRIQGLSSGQWSCYSGDSGLWAMHPIGELCLGSQCETSERPILCSLIAFKTTLKVRDFLAAFRPSIQNFKEKYDL